MLRRLTDALSAGSPWLATPVRPPSGSSAAALRHRVMRRFHRASARIDAVGCAPAGAGPRGTARGRRAVGVSGRRDPDSLRGGSLFDVHVDGGWQSRGDVLVGPQGALRTSHKHAWSSRASATRSRDPPSKIGQGIGTPASPLSEGCADGRASHGGVPCLPGRYGGGGTGGGPVPCGTQGNPSAHGGDVTACRLGRDARYGGSPPGRPFSGAGGHFGRP